MTSKKIYAISVIRNEEDIIEESLKYAKQWFDKIIVFDNGSTDRTWEIVNDLSDDQIIPYTKKDVPYSDALRNEIFNKFKYELNDNDWWAIQDADEFYISEPRRLIEKYKYKYDVITSKKVDYVPSKEQVETWITENFDFDINDVSTCNPWAWSEMRLFRNREKLVWNSNKEWPDHIGRISPPLINIKHHPIRSLTQLQNKFKEKKGANLIDQNMFKHLAGAEIWKDMLPYKSNLMEGYDLNEVFAKIESKNNLGDSFQKYFIKTILQKLKLWP